MNEEQLTTTIDDFERNAIKTICEEKPYKSCYNKYGYDPKTGYEPALLYDSNGNP